MEQGRRLDPVTVNTTAGLPAAAEVCDKEAIVGVASGVVGVESVKVFDADVPTEFVTVTDTGPGDAAWAAGMVAVSWVALTNVVDCSVPFQFTAASLVKFVPFTVKTKP
jgi:hypothetical protein